MATNASDEEDLLLKELKNAVESSPELRATITRTMKRVAEDMESEAQMLRDADF